MKQSFRDRPVKKKSTFAVAAFAFNVLVRASVALSLALFASIGSYSVSQCAAAEPFQVVEGKHILLRADASSRESMQDYVQAFDAAVPQLQPVLVAYLACAGGRADRARARDRLHGRPRPDESGGYRR